MGYPTHYAVYRTGYVLLLVTTPRLSYASLLNDFHQRCVIHSFEMIVKVESLAYGLGKVYGGCVAGMFSYS